MMGRRTLAALLAGTAIAGGGVALVLSRLPREPEVREAPAPVVDAAQAVTPRESWCDPSLEPLAGEGCLAAAPDAGAGAPLVLYLHGMYERTAGKADELDRQRRVAAQARAKGFALLAVHGKEGECNARPELATWFCWPSNERTAGDAAAFVGGWKIALDAAAARNVGAGRRYVLGFSNGAFFAGLVAVRALFAADAFVVAHGGPVQPVKAVGRMPPVLLMSADGDDSQDGMIYLDALLAHEHWPHDTYARSGGHALTDADIDAALTFFARTASEAVPLRPPITEHRPVLHSRDAAAPAAQAVQATATDDAPVTPSPDDAGTVAPRARARAEEEQEPAPAAQP